MPVRAPSDVGGRGQSTQELTPGALVRILYP
jgi:hypothetical protein